MQDPHLVERLHPTAPVTEVPVDGQRLLQSVGRARIIPLTPGLNPKPRRPSNGSSKQKGQSRRHRRQRRLEPPATNQTLA